MGDQSTIPRSASTRGYLVHVYTASGIIPAFLATVAAVAGNPRWAFLWLAMCVFIDATDGALARRWRVKETAPHIDGRTIDDLLDYLTFTFIPLLLVWRMGWIPRLDETTAIGGAVFVGIPMLASLLGFANVKAKEEAGGFFRGFPSYWNIAAFYCGLLVPYWGAWGNGVFLLILAVLTVAPIRMVYPTLAPPPWRMPVLAGSLLWALGLLAMLPWYPARIPGWAVLLSLVYPAFYTVLSVHLDVQDRRKLRRLSEPVA